MPRDTLGQQQTRGHWDDLTEQRAGRLRPWPEVVRLYFERCGESISPQGACVVHDRAVRKLKIRLRAVLKEIALVAPE